MLSPFSREGNSGTERVGQLPKATQLGLDPVGDSSICVPDLTPHAL